MSSNLEDIPQDSCSDCKLEQWEDLLLKWLNECVHPKHPVGQLNKHSLLAILQKYKYDISKDETDEQFYSADKAEVYFHVKYPLLRLKHVTNAKEYYKKLYILTTLFLYHCCTNSINGEVDHDIRTHLNKEEQEMISRFCETLTDFNITCSNIETAIRNACNGGKNYKKEKLSKKKQKNKPTIMYSESCMPSDLNRKLNRVKTDNVQTSPRIVYYDTNADNSCICSLGQRVVLKQCSTYKNINTQIDLYSSEDLEGLSEKRNITSQDTTKEIPNCCQPGCACIKCSPDTPGFGDSSASKLESDEDKEKKPNRRKLNMKKYAVFFALFLLLLIVAIVGIVLWLVPDLLSGIKKVFKKNDIEARRFMTPPIYRMNYLNSYECKNSMCQKSYGSTNAYTSLSRCILLCMGPQLWPYPIGFTFFSDKIVAISTKKLEYKFQSLPSESVHSYLAEAFKFFIGDLVKLEKMHIENRAENNTKDLLLKKMNIQIDIETDSDPRVRLNTDETYNLKIDENRSTLTIKISSPSFCGARHALETLSQLVLLDQTTGYLITLSNVIIRDAPSYKYRGLMIDTGRNYIPVTDLIRTVDAMATCKLNTFHWRITDATSFPLYIPTLPQLFEYGAYDRKLVYTKEDIRTIVKRASIRGIRVLIEVAAPGPVGRAWSWSADASCPTKTVNFTCSNVLCLRLAMRESVMDILQIIYMEIIDLTNVNDIFHLSDSLFSLVSCYYLIEEREGFLERALERLKRANRGVLPKLPIIWYTNHLAKGYEAKSWDRLGVQLTEWQPNPSDQFLSRFKVIHSSKWDLSCEIKKLKCKKYKTWQEMYSWKSWRNIEVFSIEGGETLLWTDLVDSGNLDYHLWPRAAAVAERLWSDIAVNSSVTPSVYVRLDSHRWRMLLKSIKVQPIWPVYCTFHPDKCIRQLRSQK